MSDGCKTKLRKYNRLSRYNPIELKNRLLESEALNESSGEESQIPCNQIQFSEHISRHSSNIFESTPKLLTKNSSLKNSLLIKNAISSTFCEENLSVSTLDDIFNSSFNHDGNSSTKCSLNKNNQNASSDELSIFNSSESFKDKIDCHVNGASKKEKEGSREKCKNDERTLFYDLPSNIKHLIKQYKGIDKLYDWQDECLTLSAVKQRRNLIYALPTSGGKTLVAEILMLKEVVCNKKNVLFILPFVSIVQEKIWALSPFAVNCNFLIEEYAGGKGVLPPRQRKQKKSIYIATIEKALMLIRSLIENNRLMELGMIVIDELHLLGEPNRGTTLEVLLTNVLYSEVKIQIVGMSATIGNIQELSQFINAKVYTKDFRPVELKEFVKVGNNIYSINHSSSPEDSLVFSRKANFHYSSEAEKIDSDHLGGLVMEVIPNGSCLIFCPTKKNCENVASTVLRSILPKKLLEHRKREKTALQDAIKMESEGNSLLIDLVVWGIAYHHAGLTFEERRLIEEAFRSGVLNILCCTSTLAAGVNLPAQRVILRAPFVGRKFISLSMYKQMVGRAGRAGFGGHGDSILICPSHSIDQVKTMISSPMESVDSNLHGDDGTHMRSFVLGSISSNVATTRTTLRQMLSKSLLHVQAQRLDVNIKEQLDIAIKRLVELSAIQLKDRKLKSDMSVTINKTLNNSRIGTDDNAPKKTSTKERYEITRDDVLVVSKLGRAAVRGCFSLCHARWLYADLKSAQQCLVLTDVLHLLYLVTPYDVAENVYPNWSAYKNALENLNEDSRHTIQLIGFTEYSIVNMASRKMPKNMTDRVFKRFYATLMLHNLWRQESLQDVSDRYEVGRGVVQLLMEQASAFCASVIKFCEEIDEFWAFKDLLVGFSARLSHCCIQELVPLMELPSVKKNRALQLYRAGFKTLKSIANCDANVLMESVEHLPFRTAKQLIATAKLLLLEKVENLREQAQEFMDGDLFAE